MATETWIQEQRPGYRTITRTARLSGATVEAYAIAWRELWIVLGEAILHQLVNGNVAPMPTHFDTNVSIERKRDDAWLRVDCYLPEPKRKRDVDKE